MRLLARLSDSEVNNLTGSDIENYPQKVISSFSLNDISTKHSSSIGAIQSKPLVRNLVRNDHGCKCLADSKLAVSVAEHPVVVVGGVDMWLPWSTGDHI